MQRSPWRICREPQHCTEYSKNAREKTPVFFHAQSFLTCEIEAGQAAQEEYPVPLFPLFLPFPPVNPRECLLCSSPYG